MSSNESKPALKIFCSKCDQKMDVTEFKSFATFPCPVCKTENTVPKRLGEHVLIEKLSDDDEFENYIALKDAKKISVRVFKKKIEGALGIKACLGMLSKEHSSYEFSEFEGQLIGICEDLKAVEKKSVKSEVEKSKKTKTSEKKKSPQAKKKTTAKSKADTKANKSEQEKKETSKKIEEKGSSDHKNNTESSKNKKTATAKTDGLKAPTKPIKIRKRSKSNNNSTIIIFGVVAALAAIAFVMLPGSPKPNNQIVSNTSDTESKAKTDSKAQKELEKKQELAQLEEEKQIEAEELARKEAEELARKEEEERLKELARIKEEEKQRELADFLSLIKPSEEQRKKFASLPPVSNTHFQKLMNNSCIDCHNVKKRKGDLDATMFTTPTSIYISFERIKDIYASVKSGDMPPEDEEFSDSEREHLLAYIEKIIFTLESKPAKVPSTAMVRRLTPYEYDYTVQDITGLDLEFAESFPAESSGGQGFVNDAQQLNVSPILMEKYMEAAEKIASYSEFDLLKGFTFSKKASPLQRPEKYEEEIRRKMYSYLKGFYPRKFSIQGYLPKLISACAEIAKDKNKSLEEVASKHSLHPIFLKNGLKYFSNLSGKSKTETAILRNWPKLRSSKKPDELLKDITQQFVSAYTSAETIINNRQNKERFKHIALVKNIESLFYVDKVSAAKSLSAEKLQEYLKLSDIYLFSRFSTNIRQASAAHAHIKPLIYKLLYKLNRRPPSEKELSLRVNDVLNDTIRFGLPMATRILLIREFCSFNFFFRIEHKRETKIDDYDLASRLSYFLWAGPPDEELLRLASEKKLSDEKVLDKQILRMLKNKKSARLAKHFAEQWLKIDQILKSAGPEKEIFAGFDKDLGKDMWMETAMCFNYIVKNDRSMLELLSSDYTIINNRLSRIYGLDQNSPQFKKVYVKNGQRGGLIGHASILTMTSLGKRTSPIIRGTWVLSVLLGTPPPPPPMDVEELPEGEAVSEDFSIKEQLAHHRNNPSCKSCHKKIDPLGVVMENYDTVGRWRNNYINKTDIDSISKINGNSIEGPVGLKKYLMDNKILYMKNLSKKLLSYALGRDIHFHDNFTVNKMIENAIRNDYSFSSLVKTIVSSPQFQHK